MKRFTIILCAVLVGCAAPQRRVLPPIPTVSRQAAPIVGQAEGQAVVAPPVLTVRWDHVQEPGDAYEVWSSTNAVVWLPLAVTTNHMYLIQNQKPAEYFMVRATNHLSHQVSPWATTR